MELFDRAHGLLFTMTTITPSFFAPERSIEHHSVAKKMAWRPLLISGCAHVFGVIVVSLVVWLVIKAVMGVRVSEEEEFDGVDMSECGLEAYPDFTSSRS